MSTLLMSPLLVLFNRIRYDFPYHAHRVFREVEEEIEASGHAPDPTWEECLQAYTAVKIKWMLQRGLN